MVRILWDSKPTQGSFCLETQNGVKTLSEIVRTLTTASCVLWYKWACGIETHSGSFFQKIVSIVGFKTNTRKFLPRNSKWCQNIVRSVRKLTTVSCGTNIKVSMWYWNTQRKFSKKWWAYCGIKTNNGRFILRSLLSGQWDIRQKVMLNQWKKRDDCGILKKK